MASRQEQLHSYQFAVQRMVSALVARDGDPARSPLRRTAGATMAGILLTALSLAAVALYGVLRPGDGTGWRDPTAVIEEKQSGARYLLRDGRLHPVLNFSSALLLTGAQGHVVRVDRRTLAGVPRGEIWGISGAPDAVPPASALLDQPWTVCSTAPQRAASSVLYLEPAGSAGRPLGDEDAVLGTLPAGGSYLIWRGTALRIPRPVPAVAALGWAAEPPVPLAAALVDALPAGPDLAPPVIPGAGTASALPGLRVGTVVVTQNQGGGRQYAVALRAGLAPVSQVLADLLVGDPALGRVLGQRAARSIAPGDYARAPRAILAGAAGLPEHTPTLRRPARAELGICATPGTADQPARVSLDSALPGLATALRPAPPADQTGAVGPVARPADRIVVPAGRAVLVAAEPGGSWYLVTDQAIRYPLSSPDVAAALGYPGHSPVRVDSAVVSLLPAGPALDPAAVATS